MQSELAQADLLSAVKEAGPKTQIRYQLFAASDGYGLSAGIVGKDADAVCIPHLSADREAAKRIFSLLSENTVFPYNICEVLDDLLAVDPLP